MSATLIYLACYHGGPANSRWIDLARNKFHLVWCFYARATKWQRGFFKDCSGSARIMSLLKSYRSLSLPMVSGRPSSGGNALVAEFSWLEVWSLFWNLKKGSNLGKERWKREVMIFDLQVVLIGWEHWTLVLVFLIRRTQICMIYFMNVVWQILCNSSRKVEENVTSFWCVNCLMNAVWQLVCILSIFKTKGAWSKFSFVIYSTNLDLL